MSEQWAVVMVEPRGSLLDGHHASILNQQVFDSRKKAQHRADSQAIFVRNFYGGDSYRFVVVDLSEATEGAA